MEGKTLPGVAAQMQRSTAGDEHAASSARTAAPAVDLPDHFEKRIPHGDNRERLVCARCEFIRDYQNPKVVAGGSVHLEATASCSPSAPSSRARASAECCPRATWSSETTEQAAQREAREEACATIEIDRLLAMYSVARIGQVQIMYRARGW